MPLVNSRLADCPAAAAGDTITVDGAYYYTTLSGTYTWLQAQAACPADTWLAEFRTEEEWDAIVSLDSEHAFWS